MNESSIRTWLLAYAWCDDTAEQKQAVVNCIMSQGQWKYISARADQYAGAQAEPGPAAFSEGEQFALSELYECHDKPHLPNCPHAR